MRKERRQQSLTNTGQISVQCSKVAKHAWLCAQKDAGLRPLPSLEGAPCCGAARIAPGAALPPLCPRSAGPARSVPRPQPPSLPVPPLKIPSGLPLASASLTSASRFPSRPPPPTSPAAGRQAVEEVRNGDGGEGEDEDAGGRRGAHPAARGGGRSARAAHRPRRRPSAPPAPLRAALARPPPAPPPGTSGRPLPPRRLGNRSRPLIPGAGGWAEGAPSEGPAREAAV